MSKVRRNKLEVEVFIHEERFSYFGRQRTWVGQNVQRHDTYSSQTLLTRYSFRMEQKLTIANFKNLEDLYTWRELIGQNHIFETKTCSEVRSPSFDEKLYATTRRRHIVPIGG